MGLFNFWILHLARLLFAMNKERQLEDVKCVRCPKFCDPDPIKNDRVLIPHKITDLEVSKPQRNTRPPPSTEANPPRGTTRRSRSPDYGRVMSPRGRGSSTFRGGRGDFAERGFSRGRETRERDHEYPARRSSPPPRYRARDDYRPHHRERSRSPPGRYRPRTRSPPPVEELPRRDSREVPEVQAIVTDELDRLAFNS